MSKLTTSQVSVRYGRRTVVNSVSISASAGEVTVVAGPNGSGKSSLIKAISGEVGFDGTVMFNGLDLRSITSRDLATRRAVLPQETSVTFPFTVSEIVRLGLEAGGTAWTLRSAAILDAALEKVRLKGFSQRLLPELSGGERQRVQLARVLCQIWEPVGPEGPRWLIMDEPVASLDIRHQIGLMELAREYAQRGGGVIAVMHDLNLSAIYADRLVLMRSGAVAAEGTPAEVLTASRLAEVFECPLLPNVTPASGIYILPQSVAV